jgi:hypothetical protein
MFSNETTYAYAMLTALTVAVVVAFVALVHAFHGLQFFW